MGAFMNFMDSLTIMVGIVVAVFVYMIISSIIGGILILGIGSENVGFNQFLLIVGYVLTAVSGVYLLSRRK